MRTKEEHVRGHGVTLRGDKSFELVLEHPCSDVNRELFEAELETALAHAERLGAEVFWFHNAVRVSTVDELHGAGAWACFTERNAEMAN